MIKTFLSKLFGWFIKVDLRYECRNCGAKPDKPCEEWCSTLP